MAEAISPKVTIAASASLNVVDLSVLARSTETVPHAADGMDQRIGLLIVDLATHASDIDVDDIGRGIEVKIPHVLQQHRAGDDAAFVADQILQKLEFPRKQRNVLAATVGGARDQVDREIADPQDGILRHGLASPAERFKPRQQFD